MKVEGKRREIESEEERIRAEVARRMRSAKEEAEQETERLKLNACRYTVADKRNIYQLSLLKEFTPTNVAKLRKEALEAPERPSENILEQMRSIRCPRVQDGRMRPTWLPLFCWNRDDIKGTVIDVTPSAVHGGGSYFFDYATQNEYTAFFMVVEAVVDPMRPHPGEGLSIPPGGVGAMRADAQIDTVGPNAFSEDRHAPWFSPHTYMR